LVELETEDGILKRRIFLLDINVLEVKRGKKEVWLQKALGFIIIYDKLEKALILFQYRRNDDY